MYLSPWLATLTKEHKDMSALPPVVTRATNSSSF